MSLEFQATVPERGFDVQLSVAAGETTAVLGPNGAGKSTLLAVLAGLLRPESGRAVLDGTTLFDLGHGTGTGTGSGRPHWRRPHERGVALLAQDALLFPHLSALENVAFGPRSRRGGERMSRPAARASAAHWLAEVDATELAERRPAELSGGQAQRIAVARALAADPRLLLLDEPMAALDIAVAPALRRTLRRVLAERTAIIVTHEVLDAYTLADRVVVMDGGRIVDAGPTRAVFERPTSPFTAGLAGLELLTGTASDGRVVLGTGERLSGRVDIPLTEGSPTALAVRPSAVRLTVDTDDGAASSTAPAASGAAPANRLAARVIDLEPRGDLVRVRTDRLAADLAPAELAALDLTPGTPVLCAFSPDDARAYPL